MSQGSCCQPPYVAEADGVALMLMRVRVDVGVAVCVPVVDGVLVCVPVGEGVNGYGCGTKPVGGKAEMQYPAAHTPPPNTGPRKYTA